MSKPFGKYILSAVSMAEMNILFNQLLGWITYLDSCSLGKTQDFQNCLDSMALTLRNAKNICNSAVKVVDLP